MMEATIEWLFESDVVKLLHECNFQRPNRRDAFFHRFPYTIPSLRSNRSLTER